MDFGWGSPRYGCSSSESSSWRKAGNRCPPPVRLCRPSNCCEDPYDYYSSCCDDYCPPRCPPNCCKPCCKPRCPPNCCRPCCKPKCCPTQSNCCPPMTYTLQSTGVAGSAVAVSTTPTAVPLSQTTTGCCQPCPPITFTSNGFIVNQQTSVTITGTTTYAYSPALVAAGTASTYILVNGTAVATSSTVTAIGATTASGGLATLTTTLAAGSIVQLGATAGVATTTIGTGSFLNVTICCNQPNTCYIRTSTSCC